MKVFIFIWILFFLLIVQNSCGHKLTSSKNSIEIRDSVIIGYETQAIDTSKLVKRTDSNLVILSFFEKFDDTVILYINGVEKWRSFISNQSSSLNSTGYSGIDVGVIAPHKNTTIRLSLFRQKKFIDFLLDTEYPMCSIQRYNNIWHVNYRRHVLFIK